MKTSIIILLLVFFLLLQISFLSHFTVWGRTPGIVMAFVLIWNLYEDRKRNFGLIVALFAGLLLDVFSEGFIGYQISILLVLSISIKKVLKQHVRIPFANEI